MKRLVFVFPYVLISFGFLAAQPAGTAFHPVYNDSVVATIRVVIDPDSLAAILNPANADSDHEYPATFIFDNGRVRDTLQNIGFRLRGNTSRDARKKSFKVSVNSFVRGRKFLGLEKLNVNSEHNDPSIIRAKICWDLFAASGVKASRSSHTRLYINSVYWGLYINVEHIDENFALDRFGNNDGNLYKCLWPADLSYLGNDPNLYKRVVGGRRMYELSTNKEVDDYTDLANLVSVINLTPNDGFIAAIQEVFNVNGFLRLLAVDVATGSWDDYWFNKNNYYLYHNTATGKFEFIPYDYDNTLGIWWTSIMAGVNWGTRDIYAWGHPTESRPLTMRILAIPELRNRFTFYVRRLLQRNFVETKAFPRIDSIHTMITQAAEADSFRTLDYGFTVADFHNSYTQSLGRHVTYGLKPYITARRNSALGQLATTNVAPILSDPMQNPGYPFAGDPVTFTLRVEDELLPASVSLRFRVNGSGWQSSTMLDDGLHGDGTAGDEVFGVTLSGFPANSFVEYYYFASDVQGQTSVEPYGAPAVVKALRFSGAAPKVFINEFMAKNDTTIRDPFGQLEDWIEIYNGDSVAVRMHNWYLSDNFGNPRKWRFPDTTVAPHGFLLIWADEDTNQGPLHATFKLERNGERIGLYRSDSTTTAAVDTVSFGYQVSDAATGRMPDGTPGWQVMARATPGFTNRLTGVDEQNNGTPAEFALEPPYPNPFNAQVTIGYRVPFRTSVRISILDLLGREIGTLVSETRNTGRHTVVWKAENCSSGLYFCRFQSGAYTATAKILLMK